uniref:Abhydrolase domain-containing protein 14A n=1 Tax=Magallana gigas TaxID=29159 RepID=K1RDS5_MAGGI|eukprot:XP_011418975.1 PREDICTED: protein ABHD14A [Crassostrea gigas]
MSPSGIHVNKSVVLLILAITVGIIVFNNYKYFSTFLTKKNTEVEMTEISQAILDKAKTLDVKTHRIEVEVEDGQSVEIVYRDVLPKLGGTDILFLHGQSFSSEDWEKTDTLAIFSALGYQPVAVDLPEGKNSKSQKVDVGDRGLFLEKLITALDLRTPVIVSPSMSGSYSLPFLFMDPANVSKRSAGFIPIAPVQTESYSQEKYKSLNIPTAIVYGENDRSVGPVSTTNLKNLPDHDELHMIKGAGHAAWKNKPEEFHLILYKFLLKETK